MVEEIIKHLAIDPMRKHLLFVALGSQGVVALGIGTGAVDAVVEWRVKSGLMDASVSGKSARPAWRRE